MKVSIKLIICYLAAVICVFFSVNVWGSATLESKMLEELEERYYSEAQTLVDEVIPEYLKRIEGLSLVRRRLAQTDMLIEARIWLINAEGTVIVDSKEGSLEPANIVNGYNQSLLDRSINRNAYLPDDSSTPMLMVNVPIMMNYRMNGYICIWVPMERAVEMAESGMNTLNLVILIISAILFVIFLIIYLFTILPVKKLRKAAIEYSKGHYDHKIAIHTHDEYRDMRDAMSFMVGELNEAEEKQRKFLANISHDFRSPLTSIKGYAEAIKDGTIPYESKDKYLDIILFEAERLHKLTSNILELNSMDNGAVKLDIKSFNINKVIKSIADSFEGRCRQKKLTILLQFEEADIYVDGDLGKIEQVIYNLTDNAIKFSDSGSDIVIGVDLKGGKAVIRVKDSGCGIPRDSIKKIWDRFYKSDSSRGKDKKGTGVGLSIVKEIIAAHDENINVVSTEGVGTEFSFTLPIS